MKKIRIFFTFFVPLLLVGATCLSLFLLFRFVDLKPQVDENFFFAEDDPQFQIDKQIDAIFPQLEQMLIVVKSSVFSDTILKIQKLTNEIAALPEIQSVQSITSGPKSMTDVLESPLWSRILLSSNREATNLLMFINEGSNPEVLVPKLEKLQKEYEQPGFQMMISGVPYINELIRQNLENDLKKFSLAAFVVFGIAVILIFRSFSFFVGTLVCCINASVLTLILNEFLRFKIGLLTANLSTIVFVLTLSHIIFLTFNWKYLMKREEKFRFSSLKTIQITFTASFWSMLTTFLGFLSLLFVEATPLRRLGISGALGTLMAFVIAYSVYPWFLELGTLFYRAKKASLVHKLVEHVFLSKRLGIVVFFALAFGVVAMFGIKHVDTDPSLLSYFKEGGEIRKGLDYADNNGGSSPVSLVVESGDGFKLNDDKGYKKLWALHDALESDPNVGMVISLPLIMAEARRVPFANWLSWERVLKYMELAKYDEIAKYFITKDRRKGFFFIRMKEGGRTEAREDVVNRIKIIVRDKGFSPHLVGGVYLLQKKLSELIVSSIQQGLSVLMILFIFMTFFLSYSIRITWAMFLSLSLIPLSMLGLMGYFRIPLDIISSPSVNLAIAMGVDAMIHMLIFLKRYRKKTGETWWNCWVEARLRLWKPIICAMFIIGSGFAIFTLSNFPPTQRFGLCVVIGSLMSPLATIFVLPYLAGVPFDGEDEEPITDFRSVRKRIGKFFRQ